MDPALGFALGMLVGLIVAGLAAAAALGLTIGPRLRARALEEERGRLSTEAEARAREALGKEREAAAAEQAAARRKVDELDARVRGREDGLDRRLDALEERERALRVREAELTGRHAALEAERAEVERTVQRNVRELERISGLRREEAERLLLANVETRCREEAAEVAVRTEAALRHDLERRAREALLAALGRAAWDQAPATLVTVVPVPSDEHKGLLVGRDGRNARTLQQLTGVDLLIDDTPGVVVLSAFDPERREVARRAVLRLLADGRVHPQKIEEAVAAARAELEGAFATFGREAAAEAGVTGLPAALEQLVGRLELRTSEGANVRRHSVETARLAGLLAVELGLDPALARRAGLLHDVGLTSEEPGLDHAAAGAEAARRHGETPAVVDAIARHHHEVDAAAPLTALVQVANALSARRPGARDGALEEVVRRRAEAEAIAAKQPGVERAWAVQAGRELRVLVDPQKVGDRQAQRLARDVARAVEAAGAGPGEVRVTVIREVKVEETAG